MSTAKDHHIEHLVPLRVYLGVGAALVVLTAVTVGVSLIPLGGWNVVVALGIATIKATLVALVFMHLLYDKKIFMIIFITAILFVGLFIIFIMFDTLHRGDLSAEPLPPMNPSGATYPGTPAVPDSGAMHGADSTAAAPSEDSQGSGGNRCAETHRQIRGCEEKKIGLFHCGREIP